MPKTRAENREAKRRYLARRKANDGACATCGERIRGGLLYCGEPCRDAKLAEFDALYPWVRNGHARSA